ncbi:hypothetical protein HY024_03780 [Candidatus Curtissbacteria bacterium]|nr:hypothetical protein [Candidatus Curtissbacteria bacterium]
MNEQSPNEFEAKVQAVLQQNTPGPVRKTASWKVTLALAVFPPLGFYLMWKDKTYHSWFSWLNWVFGIFLLVYIWYAVYILIPQINHALGGINGKVVSLSSFETIAIVGFSILQIAIGFWIRFSVRKNGELGRGMLICAIVLLSLDYFVPTYLYSKIIEPIYSAILG